MRLIRLENDEAGVGLGPPGRQQEIDRSQRRGARFETQEPAQAVVDRVDVVQLFGNRVSRDLRHAANRDPADLAFAMHIQQLDRLLPSHLKILIAIFVRSHPYQL